ncbi:MAG: response regulator, partial [Chloroflexi bacterium]|nr:response regulator [Chloroflexota bacterium]
MEVVLIEDDPSMVGIISLAFQMRLPEARLMPTRLGIEGLELVKRRVPNVVILDLGLPDIDGLEVLEGIRLFSSV